MPVRIADIPGLAADNGYHPPQADFNVAEAPAKALGGVARSVSELGGTFTEIAHQIQAATDKTQVIKKRSDWARAEADLNVRLQQEPDPEKWQGIMQKTLDEQRQQLDSPDLSRGAQSELKQTFPEFEARLYAGTVEGAARQTIRNASATTQQALQDAPDLKSFDVVYNDSVHAGVASAEDYPQARAAKEEELDYKAKLAEAQQHPADFLKANPPGTPFRGNVARGEKLRQTAVTSHNEQSHAQTDTVTTGIRNMDITTPAQVEAATPGMRPEAREHLTGLLKTQTPEAQRAMLEPGQQTQLYAQYHYELRNASPQIDDLDRNYSYFASMAAQMPAGPLYDDMIGSLNRMKQGVLTRADNAAQKALQMVDSAYQSGLFGSGTAPATLRQILDDGLLGDRKKLMSLGYSADQAEAVASLNPDKLRAALKEVSPEGSNDAGMTAARLSVQSDNDARLEAFRLLSRARRNPVTAGGYEVAAAEALRSGASLAQPLTWQSPQELELARRRYADVRIGILDWARRNPDKVNDDKAVHDQMLTLARPAAVDAAVRSINGAPPPDPGQAPYHFNTPAEDRRNGSATSGNAATLTPDLRR